MADQLFKKRKAAREKRKIKPQRFRSEHWLFVCEGECTERKYIESLIEYANSLSDEKPINADVHGLGKNTLSLVKSVEDFFDFTEECCSKKSGIPYSKVFVLFDKDSFSPDQFNSAIFMAISKKYIPIWSNECFELWFILHYEYYTSDNGRNSYFQKLSELMGKEYQKNEDIFKTIHTSERLQQAIKNAQKLESNSCYEKSFAKRVPCTQMHILIEHIQYCLNIDLTK